MEVEMNAEPGSSYSNWIFFEKHSKMKEILKKNKTHKI